MITAVHTLIYSEDVEATRAFLRDVLAWPHLDVHEGWLIFKTGPSELGVHPTSEPGAGDSGAAGVHHEVTLMCDDLDQTVAELRARGAEFTRDSRDDGWGLTIPLRVPGAGEMLLYQPRHPPAYDL
jgi:catechol 2,3-dioxygenase-like lactoylglutathione lyase family enzyme